MTPHPRAVSVGSDPDVGLYQEPDNRPFILVLLFSESVHELSSERISGVRVDVWVLSQAPCFSGSEGALSPSPCLLLVKAMIKKIV